MGKLNLRNLGDQCSLCSRRTCELRLGTEKGHHLLPVPGSSKQQTAATEGLRMCRVQFGGTLEGRDRRLVVLLLGLENNGLRYNQTTLGPQRRHGSLSILKRTKNHIPVVRALDTRDNRSRKGRRIGRAGQRLVEKRVGGRRIIQPQPRDVGRSRKQPGRRGAVCKAPCVNGNLTDHSLPIRVIAPRQVQFINQLHLLRAGGKVGEQLGNLVRHHLHLGEETGSADLSLILSEIG